MNYITTNSFTYNNYSISRYIAVFHLEKNKFKQKNKDNNNMHFVIFYIHNYCGNCLMIICMSKEYRRNV